MQNDDQEPPSGLSNTGVLTAFKPDATSVGGGRVIPRAPTTLEQTGLSLSFLQELVLKIVHYVELPTTEHLSRVVGLPMNLVNDVLEGLKKERLCEIVTGSAYDLAASYRLRLTERGQIRAEEALERCRYAGAAPVTLGGYERVITAQVDQKWRPGVESIRAALNELVLDEAVSEALERALHSGRSAMLFGPSGNGKTHILSKFIDHLTGELLVPHAIYAYGQIIRVYDPLVHVRINDDEPRRAENGESGVRQRAGASDDGDRRWVRIRRPGLIVAGELSAEHLELGYDSVARFYQAPKHLKAQGGVLVVDDFGRQRVSPTDLLNRWIMALERGRDNLLLRTGESIEVPFSMTLLFSTNLNPQDLADAAFLRRIPYKVYIPTATREQFGEILRQAADEHGITYSADGLAEVSAYVEEACGQRLSGSLARDLAALVVDNAHHDGREPALETEAVSLAFDQFTGQANNAGGSEPSDS